MVTRLNADGSAAIDQSPQADDTPENADLAALLGEATALEGAADAKLAALPQVATTTAAELHEALGLLRTLASPALPDWPAYGVSVWSDKQLEAISVSGGAIMDRHGWTMGEVMTAWGPYIGLIAALGPPAIATYAHIQERKAQRLEWERNQRGGGAGQQRPGHEQPPGPGGA